jgi:protoheme IX farnesyltransferase
VQSVPATRTTAADLLSLTKPRLSSLVLLTTAGGMYLAPASTAHPLSHLGAFLVLLATAGTVGAANALNCYAERDSDRFMRRTAVRPLPTGRMEPKVALGFGAGLAAVSIPTLFAVAGPLTGGLALLAFVSYVFGYTPLKARSHHAMVVGALPGALPPLMGWTARTGALDAPGLVLFGILFLWQLPHFLAIALFRKDEYLAAGLKSVPLVRGDAAARAQVVGYLLLLLPVSFALYPLGAAGPLYLAAAVLLGGAFTAHGAWGCFKKGDAAWARQLFLISLVYLSGLFLALWLDAGLRA